MAGTAVDVALYPLDTIKTRLQSPEGFIKAGGLRGVYNGLSAAAVGSAPGGTYVCMLNMLICVYALIYLDKYAYVLMGLCPG